MIKYKNTSVAVKTFYGKEFKPGESQEVPGYINDVSMIRVSDKLKTSTPTTKKPSSQTAVTQAVSKSNKETKQGGESDGSDNHK